jgi:succinoglycan biosynthesis transport protein ExoP
MSQRNSEYDVPAVLLPPGEVSVSAGGWQRRAVDLREMARILRRHRKIVLGIPLILLIASAIFCFVVTPRYTATATVLVDPRRANVLDTSDTNSQQVLSSFGTDDATIESQALLVQSVGVLQRVVQKLDLTHDSEFSPQPSLLDPIKRLLLPRSPATGASAEDIAVGESIEILQKRLKVTRQGTTFLVDINVSSESATKAAKIANAIADEYFLDQVNSKSEATKIAADWLNSQIDALRAKVLISEKAVEDFRSANNLVVSQGVTVNDQQITDLNNKLIEARADTAQARAKYEQVQQIAKKGSDPGSVAEALSSDVIANLRTQYADIAKNLADLTARYGPLHPSVANVEAQLRDTQRLINAEVQRILDGTRHNYEIAQSREASLENSLNDLKNEWTGTGPAQVRLRELQREAEANRTIYESFLARYRETSAQESLEMPDSRVVTRASIPIQISFPKTLLILGLAAVLGLGLGGVFAFLVDYLDRCIKTPEQAEGISGIPAIAAVPLISAREIARRAKRGRWELDRYDPSVVRLLPPLLQPPLLRYSVDEPSSIFAEEIRAIRFAIQRSLRIDPAAKVVVVTSSIDGEGKTTTAANVALSLAMIGIRTVLVDGDLRNPELTHSLCPHAGTGLFDVAFGRQSIDAAIMVERTTGLAILASPPTDDGAVWNEFATSEAMSAVVDELRQRFEVIVVDSSPVMSLVDGRALAENADRIIMTIGWDRTPRDVVVQALQLLSPVRDRIIGSVLTRVDLRQLQLYDYARSAAYGRPYHSRTDIVHEAAE